MLVAAYYNLHARRSNRLDIQWTVAAAKTRRSKGNKLYGAASLTLADCTFVSQEGARQTVIRTRVKSVHAWIVGERVDSVPPGLVGVAVSYNPYVSGELRRRDNNATVNGAAFVHFGSDGRCIAYGIS
jgi:hypothetical protein